VVLTLASSPVSSTAFFNDPHLLAASDACRQNLRATTRRISLHKFIERNPCGSNLFKLKPDGR
jgi:hypothetical protein